MSDPGPLPPFVEPYPGFFQETKGPLIVAVMSSMTALALFFVLARLYSKSISSRKVDVGDWLVIVSMFLGFWYLAMAGAAVHYGGGRHIMSLTPEQATNVIKITVISFVPGVTSFVVPKFAVVILLAKLLNPSRIHIYIMWIICVIYLLMIAGMLTINFAQCTPASAAWTLKGVCWDRQITVNYALTVGIVSVLFDFYLAIYPSVVLWQLNLNWKKKLALCSSLGFGYCAGFITIYKCTTFQKLVTLQDFSYALGDVVLWTNIEANFVLIGACIPTLFPLMRKIFGASVLGGSSGGAPTPGKSGSNGLQTFGSAPNTGNAKSKKSKKGLSQFDTVDEGDSDSKYIILEERSFHYSARDMREEDAPVLQQVKGSRQPGW